jgi:hypothetical protein
MRPDFVFFFFGPGSGVLSNFRFFLYSLSDDDDAMRFEIFKVIL